MAVLTIGRGQMDAMYWITYKRDVRDLLEDFAVDRYFDGAGQGIWRGEREEAHTFIFSAISAADEAVFLDRLREIKNIYGEEAVAYTREDAMMV